MRDREMLFPGQASINQITNLRRLPSGSLQCPTLMAQELKDTLYPRRSSRNDVFDTLRAYYQVICDNLKLVSDLYFV